MKDSGDQVVLNVIEMLRRIGKIYAQHFYHDSLFIICFAGINTSLSHEQSS